jgi:hypothetical protein
VNGDIGSILTCMVAHAVNSGGARETTSHVKGDIGSVLASMVVHVDGRSDRQSSDRRYREHTDQHGSTCYQRSWCGDPKLSRRGYSKYVTSMIVCAVKKQWCSDHKSSDMRYIKYVTSMVVHTADGMAQRPQAKSKDVYKAYR